MSLYPPPATIEATVWTRLPDRFRKHGVSPEWAAVLKPGRQVHSFLEGPSFDRDGNLWVTDIPYGRIFRIGPAGDWTLVAEYDGWPNGLKIHRNGTIYIADCKLGLLQLDPSNGTVMPLLFHRHSEHFRGLNDLVFDSLGRLWFTDQGQSGRQMPNGRVYRYDLDTARLDLVLDTGPSPNGLVVDEDSDAVFVAMTRDNAIWRLPLMGDGAISKAGPFIYLSGGLSGPDGMALDARNGLWVAHMGNGCAWGFSRLGEPLWRVRSTTGLSTTNLAFGGEANMDLFITESDTGSILRATLPVGGRAMFSHAN